MATGLNQSQIVVESLTATTSDMVSSQQVVEALVASDSSMVGSQVVIEALVDPGDVNQDCAQIVLEILAVVPHFQIGSGTASLGGSATYQPVYTYIASGALNLGGSFDGINPGFLPTGGLTLDGAADVAIRYIYVSSGTLSLGNSVTVKPNYVYVSSGKLSLGENAIGLPVYNWNASGRLRLGSGFAPPRYVYEAKGGLTLGESADRASSYWIHEPEGGLTLGESADRESSYWIYEPEGGLTLGGEARIGRYYEYEAETAGLILSGSADAHYLIEYVASGGLTFTGPSIPPNFNQLVRMTFTWDMSLGVLRSWRVEGKCRPANHGCPPTHTPTDCGGQMMYFLTIQAKSITDLCQKLKSRGWLGPVSKIQRWSLPSNRSDWAPNTDPSCNTLQDIPFETVPDCIDFTVDHDVKTGAKAQSLVIYINGDFSYEASGGLGVGYQTDVISNYYSYEGSGSLGTGESAGNSSPQYHVYIADGGLGLGGEAIAHCSYLGTLIAGARSRMEVMDLDISFGVTPAAPLIVSTDTVQASCCVDLFLPTVLFLSQELTRSDNLSNFFTVNDFTLDRVQRVRYSQHRNAWLTNLKYRGVSVDNAQNEEIWNIIMEFGCLAENAVLGIPSNIWGFSILVRKQIPSKSKTNVTRLVMEFDPAVVCDLVGALTFSFTLDTILKQTTPSTVRTLVFDDELGIFNGSGYEDNASTSFDISISAPPPGVGMFDQSAPLQRLLVST